MLPWGLPSKTITEQNVGKSKTYIDLARTRRGRLLAEHLHERTSIDMCVDSNDHVVPMDTASLPEATPADDSFGSPSPEKEVEFKDILKLHKQVSDDIVITDTFLRPQRRQWAVNMSKFNWLKRNHCLTQAFVWSCQFSQSMGLEGSLSAISIMSSYYC